MKYISKIKPQFYRIKHALQKWNSIWFAVDAYYLHCIVYIDLLTHDMYKSRRVFTAAEYII